MHVVGGCVVDGGKEEGRGRKERNLAAGGKQFCGGADRATKHTRR